MLFASCQNEQVTVNGLEVDAEILSEGKGPSAGIVILDGDEACYLTSNASDIKALITSIGSILNQISIIATGLDAVTTSPGSVAAAIAQLELLKTDLQLTKELLK